VGKKLDEIAFEFFREFARFEYCIKAIRLLKPGREAKADWNKLAMELKDFFETDCSDISDAVKYFVEHPPKKQVHNDGQLEWDETLPDHKNGSLAKYVQAQWFR
jgi:hypothetical protein